MTSPCPLFVPNWPETMVKAFTQRIHLRLSQRARSEVPSVSATLQFRNKVEDCWYLSDSGSHLGFEIVDCSDLGNGGGSRPICTGRSMKELRRPKLTYLSWEAYQVFSSYPPCDENN